MTLNNPLSILSAKILGVGVELNIEHTDGTWTLCFIAEAIAWSYRKEWSK